MTASGTDAETASSGDVGPWLEEARAWADGLMEAAFAGGDIDWGPAALEEACRYALTGGGKRVRPTLVRLVGEALGGDPGAIDDAALAVECIHTYSLVHDDLPAMDDDDLRRGRATVHRRYDEATAILVGDALQSVAFEVLGRRADAAAGARAQVLARAAGPAGMVGGQVLDLASEARAGGTDADGVARIHALKTAALLGAAAELGALTAPGVTAGQREDARVFGREIGLTFQAMDDVLDVTADAAALGKTPGKDQAVGKGTLVAALGLQGARDVAGRHADRAREASARLGLGALGVGLVDTLLRRKS